MAKQILAPYTTTAVNLHALIFNGDGQVWNGSVFVPYATADLATYVVPLTEKGTASRIYAADFPTLITTGVYSWAAYRRAGGSPAEGDPLIGTGEIQWDGSTFTAMSSLPASILSAAAAAPIAANIKEINDTPVIGDGAGVPWGP